VGGELYTLFILIINLHNKDIKYEIEPYDNIFFRNLNGIMVGTYKIYWLLNTVDIIHILVIG